MTSTFVEVLFHNGPSQFLASRLEAAIRAVWPLCVVNQTEDGMDVYPDEPAEQEGEDLQDDVFPGHMLRITWTQSGTVSIRVRSLASQNIRRVIVAIEMAI